MLDFLKDHWGDLASLIGLAITILFAFQAKGAAEQARDAARQARDRIAHLDMLEELAAAVTILEEIKRLQRLSAWEVVLERYSAVRRHVIRAENKASHLDDRKLAALGRAVEQFRIIEAEIEASFLPLTGEELNIARLNRIVSMQAILLKASGSAFGTKECKVQLKKQQSDLMEKLVRQGRENRLAWEETADEDCFLTSVSKYVVTLKRVSVPATAGDMHYSIRLADQFGRLIDDFSVDDQDRPWFDLLKELFDLARSGAMQVDAAYEELLASLD